MVFLRPIELHEVSRIDCFAHWLLLLTQGLFFFFFSILYHKERARLNFFNQVIRDARPATNSSAPGSFARAHLQCNSKRNIQIKNEQKRVHKSNMRLAGRMIEIMAGSRSGSNYAQKQLPSYHNTHITSLGHERRRQRMQRRIDSENEVGKDSSSYNHN